MPLKPSCHARDLGFGSKTEPSLGLGGLRDDIGFEDGFCRGVCFRISHPRAALLRPSAPLLIQQVQHHRTPWDQGAGLGKRLDSTLARVLLFLSEHLGRWRVIVRQVAQHDLGSNAPRSRGSPRSGSALFGRELVPYAVSPKTSWKTLNTLNVCSISACCAFCSVSFVVGGWGGVQGPQALLKLCWA